MAFAADSKVGDILDHPEAAKVLEKFAKLDEEQVEGDDAAVCATIRELAPMLTPEANQPLAL